MRNFLIAAFVVAFFFSYILFGPGQGAAPIAAAIGGAIFLTLVGWVVARSSNQRWATLAMSLTAAFALIGR